MVSINFQIFNFTRPEGGIRVSRTFSMSSRIPTDNAVKFNIRDFETHLNYAFKSLSGGAILLLLMNYFVIRYSFFV